MKKAILIDRDGVINREGKLSEVKAFKVYSFVGRAVKKINEKGYLAIIVTNQPEIAKGVYTEEELRRMHKKLNEVLAQDKAKLDAIYYCPHHPDKGFPEEVKELKIRCFCRKPEIGMIKKAMADFNLDLSSSFFIGDTSIDAKTAENARIKFLGVKTGYACRDGKYKVKKKFPVYKNLLEAVMAITK